MGKSTLYVSSEFCFFPFNPYHCPYVVKQGKCRLLCYKTTTNQLHTDQHRPSRKSIQIILTVAFMSLLIHFYISLLYPSTLLSRKARQWKNTKQIIWKGHDTYCNDLTCYSKAISLCLHLVTIKESLNPCVISQSSLDQGKKKSKALLQTLEFYTVMEMYHRRD